ncbi:unnamed protein product [Durusdinium trenchii]|uniref:Uncharacterized protein n=1 Tax=Durusdinium trenchii TaxID=1381693 RepID=A0ABP0MCQ6_9DINO
MKLYWKACASALATIEHETGNGHAETITEIEHNGNLRSLEVLQHPSFQYLTNILDDCIDAMHHILDYLRLRGHSDDLQNQGRDCQLLLEMICCIMNHPHTPHYRVETLRVNFAT